MVILSDDEKNMPICDTNILINFGLSNIIDDFVSYNKKIFIADNVLRELERKFNASSTYEHLIHRVNNNSNIKVINKDEYFTEEMIMVMNHYLNQYSLTKDCLLRGGICKDSGEFISAIYAANLKIKKFITNDQKFVNRYKNEYIFKGITFINMVQVLDKLIGKEKRKELVLEIKSKSKEMEDILSEEKLLEKIQKWVLKIS